MLYRHIGMCILYACAWYDWQQLECVAKHVAVVFLDIQYYAYTFCYLHVLLCSLLVQLIVRHTHS